MRSSTCPTCGLLVFFDDTGCLRCGTELAYAPERRRTTSLGPGDRACANRAAIGCSWLVQDGADLCRSCRLTQTRPPTTDPGTVHRWAEAEHAKRRLLTQCLDLGLDIEGARFDLLSSAVEPVVTGHADGVITLDVGEADDVQRARQRARVGEAYRTVLGHFRHEIGHYLWMTLVGGTDRLGAFREVFGDERADYANALEVHYAGPPPADWQERHVSAYASAHPWEDFAETVAHYLHIRDTLQTASSYGLSVDGDHVALDATPHPDSSEIGELIGQWLPLTYALNAVNRSMGAAPLYPFVLAPPVIAKLGWVHDLFASADATP